MVLRARRDPRLLGESRVLGCGVQDLGFRIQGLGDLGFRI